jgi:hypothetical protein
MTAARRTRERQSPKPNRAVIAAVCVAFLSLGPATAAWSQAAESTEATPAAQMDLIEDAREAEEARIARAQELADLVAIERALGDPGHAAVLGRALPIAGTVVGSAAVITGAGLYTYGLTVRERGRATANRALSTELENEWVRLSRLSVLPSAGGSVLLSVSLPFLFGGASAAGDAVNDTRVRGLIRGLHVGGLDGSEIIAYRRRLEEHLEEAYSKLPGYRALEWIGFGLSATSAAALGVSLVLGQSAFERYTAAGATADAADLRARVELFRWTSVAAAGGVSIGVGTWQFSREKQRRPRRIVAELARLNQAINAAAD